MASVEALATVLQREVVKLIRLHQDGLIKGTSEWSISKHNEDMYVREKEYKKLKNINLDNEIKKLDSFNELVEAMKADSRYGAKLGKLITTYHQSGGIDAETYIQLVLVNQGELLSTEPFRQTKHRKEFLEELTAKTSKVRLLTPILGMKTQGVIKLKPNSRIIPRNHKDMVECLNWELIKPSFAGHETYWVNSSHPGVSFLVTEFDCPILIENYFTTTQRQSYKKFVDGHEWLRQTLQSTFDLHDYKINLGRTLETAEYKAMPYEGIFQPQATPDAWPFSKNLTVKRSLGRTLHSTFRQLDNDKNKSNKMLRLSANRVAIARHRDDDEDSFLDLMIACEAFYMFNERDHQDIGYKLRLRAAYWYEGEEYTKKEIMQLFSIAYDYRSRIAHGSDLKIKKFKNEDMTLKANFKIIEKILKAGLLRYVKLINSKSDNYVHDWEEVVGIR